MNIKWSEATGYTLIILAACFFGGSASLGKALMKGGISTIQLMEIRSLVTAGALLPVLILFGRSHFRIQKKDIFLFLLLGIPGLALVNASYYYAVKILPVALAVFIQFMAPVLVFLYGYFTKKEQATPGNVTALLLSLAGTYFMVQIAPDTIGRIAWNGLLSAWVATLTFAFYLILSHRLGTQYSPWTLIFYGYGFASLFWCIVQSPFETYRLLAGNHLFQGAILFSVLSTLIPFVLFQNGLRRITPTGAAIASTTETISASVFAYLFLGEMLTAGQIVGAGMILTAVLLLLLQRK